MEQIVTVPAAPETGQAQDQPDPVRWLREDVLLAFLNIPQGGILGVSSALLFTGDQIAYWWRDGEKDQQHVKMVSPQALRAAVGSIRIDSGYLPERVVRLGISPKGQQWMLVHQPPRISRLLIEREEGQSRVSIDLGLPGGLFFGIGESYFLWATKSGPLGAETPLYHFPLPNISEDGLLCFGTNQPPSVSWPQMPALSLFLDSPFNGHWAQGKSRTHPGDIRERLLALGSNPVAWFPEDELVPILDYPTSKHPVALDRHLVRVVRGY